jgi:putative ABC transport system permease protein
MKPSNVLHLYRVRLRARALQELFAVVGIAAGVALLFASQVASTSLSSSVGALNAGIVGRAKLQLTARSAEGMPESLLKEVRALPGVAKAAPLLEVQAQALGPKGSESVQLVGADPSLANLHGSLVRDTKLTPFAGLQAVVLPAPVASKIGVTKFGKEMKLRVAGHTVEVPLYGQLHEKQIGTLIASPIAVTTLTAAQELVGYGRTLSRILVEPSPGQTEAVRRGLVALAKGRLGVNGADYDSKLFSVAAEATNQSTQLFAVLSALVGFLFAFNAVLLTVAQRRRLIADLRRDGYTPGAVIAVLSFDAIVLAVIACALGLLIGDELSIHVLHSTPGYLTSAFAISTARVLDWQDFAISAGGGLLAALVAVLSPFRDIVSKDPLAAIAPKQGGSLTRVGLLAGAGVLMLAGAVAILLFAAAAAVLGMVLLTASMLALLPVPLALLLAAVRRIAPRFVSAVPHVAAMELRAGHARAVAIAATGAIAVFGAVAIEAAHGDLLHGLDDAAAQTNAPADLWVAPAGSYNRLFTAPFKASERELSKLRSVPGVASVRVYRGGLLDIGARRVWAIAPPSAAKPLFPGSQLSRGNLASVDVRLRQGGWAVLSKAVAQQLRLSVGQSFTLPSPQPLRLRVAGISTNIGWAPGAITTSAATFARGFGPNASAYEVLLRAGASKASVTTAIESALGHGSGLAVEAASARAAGLRAVSRQGLERLTQIATLILIAAVLAMGAAMGAMVWQRRPRLAKLKLEGFAPAELWRTVLTESAILLGAGCLTGAIFGLLGQQLLDRALANVIDYPVIYSFDAPLALAALALVTLAAVAAVAAPGWFAVRVPAGLALQD